MNDLMNRDKFREGVFSRDKGKCVFCNEKAQDAHHILERHLFPNGGYYLNNGASVCEKHHLLCESTEISVEEVLLKIGGKRVTPPHLYDDQIYDKWGNPVLPNGSRLRGELFFDESVQKILKNYLHLFTHYVKYPRTYHLPWSDGLNEDDRVLESIEHFRNKRIIVTKKMDGENTTMYSDYIHARSIDGRSHKSRDWVKQFWSTIAHDIPEQWRIVGENLFAEHSIHYDDLESYFYGFQIWNDKNVCLSWEETLDWFKLFGIIPVEILYDGLFNESVIKLLGKDLVWEKDEGYVIRLAEEFSYSDFRKSVAKYVRKNHIQTVKHWMYGQEVIPNKLK